jgi:hypothetical protein
MRLLDALPGDVRGIARQLIKDLTIDPRPAHAKELEDHPGYWRMWLPRNNRLVRQVQEGTQVVELLYAGPKSAELYDQLGLGKQD